MISFNYLCNFGESTEEGGVHFNFNTMTNFSNITHPFLLVAGGVPSTTIPSWRMAYISSGTNRGCGTSGKGCIRTIHERSEYRVFRPSVDPPHTRSEKPYMLERERVYCHYFLRLDNHPVGWPLLYKTPLGMFCL